MLCKGGQCGRFNCGPKALAGALTVVGLLSAGSRSAVNFGAQVSNVARPPGAHKYITGSACSACIGLSIAWSCQLVKLGTKQCTAQGARGIAQGIRGTPKGNKGVYILIWDTQMLSMDSMHRSRCKSCRLNWRR